MGYTNVALKDKIEAMYPEIEKHGITVGLDFNKEKNTYIVTFRKGVHELTTHLEKKDADECMDGIKCVHLGIQIGQFVKNFEIIEKE
ncbi:MAG TPA: hypothetical protein VMU21_08925 [Thermodesulfovibrionales bacterium]|nr:hypothetical protein [Thermodesulfovibrionales bacterium]